MFAGARRTRYDTTPAGRNISRGHQRGLSADTGWVPRSGRACRSLKVIRRRDVFAVRPLRGVVAAAGIRPSLLSAEPLRRLVEANMAISASSKLGLLLLIDPTRWSLWSMSRTCGHWRCEAGRWINSPLGVDAEVRDQRRAPARGRPGCCLRPNTPTKVAPPRLLDMRARDLKMYGWRDVVDILQP